MFFQDVYTYFIQKSYLNIILSYVLKLFVDFLVFVCPILSCVFFNWSYIRQCVTSLDIDCTVRKIFAFNYKWIIIFVFEIGVVYMAGWHFYEMFNRLNRFRFIKYFYNKKLQINKTNLEGMSFERVLDYMYHFFQHTVDPNFQKLKKISKFQIVNCIMQADNYLIFLFSLKHDPMFQHYIPYSSPLSEYLLRTKILRPIFRCLQAVNKDFDMRADRYKNVQVRTREERMRMREEAVGRALVMEKGREREKEREKKRVRVGEGERRKNKKKKSKDGERVRESHVQTHHEWQTHSKTQAQNQTQTHEQTQTQAQTQAKIEIMQIFNPAVAGADASLIPTTVAVAEARRRERRQREREIEEYVRRKRIMDAAFEKANRILKTQIKKWRIILMLTSPFLLIYNIFACILSFMTEIIQKTDMLLDIKWNHSTHWRLRLYNELPHQFTHRLDLGEKHMRFYANSVSNLSLAYFAGIVMVIISALYLTFWTLVTLFGEDFLLGPSFFHRSVLQILPLLLAAYSLTRALAMKGNTNTTISGGGGHIVDQNDLHMDEREERNPEHHFIETLKYTLFIPKNWENVFNINFPRLLKDVEDDWSRKKRLTKVDAEFNELWCRKAYQRCIITKDQTAIALFRDQDRNNRGSSGDGWRNPSERALGRLISRIKQKESCEGSGSGEEGGEDGGGKRGRRGGVGVGAVMLSFLGEDGQQGGSLRRSLNTARNLRWGDGLVDMVMLHRSLDGGGCGGGGDDDDDGGEGGRNNTNSNNNNSNNGITDTTTTITDITTDATAVFAVASNHGSANAIGAPLNNNNNGFFPSSASPSPPASSSSSSLSSSSLSLSQSQSPILLGSTNPFVPYTHTHNTEAMSSSSSSSSSYAAPPFLLSSSCYSASSSSSSPLSSSSSSSSSFPSSSLSSSSSPTSASVFLPSPSPFPFSSPSLLSSSSSSSDTFSSADMGEEEVVEVEVDVDSDDSDNNSDSEEEEEQVSALSTRRHGTGGSLTPCTVTNVGNNTIANVGDNVTNEVSVSNEGGSSHNNNNTNTSDSLPLSLSSGIDAIAAAMASPISSSSSITTVATTTAAAATTTSDVPTHCFPPPPTITTTPVVTPPTFIDRPWLQKGTSFSSLSSSSSSSTNHSHNNKHTRPHYSDGSFPFLLDDGEEQEEELVEDVLRAKKGKKKEKKKEGKTVFFKNIKEKEKEQNEGKWKERMEEDKSALVLINRNEKRRSGRKKEEEEERQRGDGRGRGKGKGKEGQRGKGKKKEGREEEEDDEIRLMKKLGEQQREFEAVHREFNSLWRWRGLCIFKQIVSPVMSLKFLCKAETNTVPFCRYICPRDDTGRCVCRHQSGGEEEERKEKEMRKKKKKEEEKKKKEKEKQKKIGEEMKKKKKGGGREGKKGKKEIKRNIVGKAAEEGWNLMMEEEEDDDLEFGDNNTNNNVNTNTNTTNSITNNTNHNDGGGRDGSISENDDDDNDRINNNNMNSDSDGDIDEDDVEEDNGDDDNNNNNTNSEGGDDDDDDDAVINPIEADLEYLYGMKEDENESLGLVFSVLEWITWVLCLPCYRGLFRQRGKGWGRKKKKEKKEEKGREGEEGGEGWKWMKKENENWGEQECLKKEEVNGKKMKKRTKMIEREEEDASANSNSDTDAERTSSFSFSPSHTPTNSSSALQTPHNLLDYYPHNTSIPTTTPTTTTTTAAAAATGNTDRFSYYHNSNYLEYETSSPSAEDMDFSEALLTLLFFHTVRDRQLGTCYLRRATYPFDYSAQECMDREVDFVQAKSLYTPFWKQPLSAKFFSIMNHTKDLPFQGEFELWMIARMDAVCDRTWDRIAARYNDLMMQRDRKEEGGVEEKGKGGGERRGGGGFGKRKERKKKKVHQYPGEYIVDNFLPKKEE